MTTFRATQGIASSFGTYVPNEVIDAEAIGPVLDAWLAAGIIEQMEDEVVEEIAEQRAAKVEKATRKAPERAVSRRMQTGETPHRRFVEKSEE